MPTLLRDRPQDDTQTRQFGRLWNTGNYFFADAVERHVIGLDIVYSAGSEPADDVLVMSMANFIAPTTDMGTFADYIERHKIRKTVMVGAGAQGEVLDARGKLSIGTRRFLDLLAERSVTIGVRGHYTAAVLAELGITNVRVIGCPTMFWNGSREFRIEKEPLNDFPRFSCSFTPNGRYRDRLALLLERAVLEGAQYYAQDENFVDAVSPEAEARRLWTAKYYSSSPERVVAVNDLLQAEKHFYSIDDWVADMRQYDFAVGTRFHGNMAALQAGTPALMLAHDARVVELCDFLNLPYMGLAEYRGQSFMELYEAVDFSFFNYTYPGKYDNYVDFLEENGLQHRLQRTKEGMSGPDFPTYREALARQILEDCQGDPSTFAREISRRKSQMRGSAIGRLAEMGILTPELAARHETDRDALAALLLEHRKDCHYNC